MKMWGGKAGGVIDRRGHLPSLSFFLSLFRSRERSLFESISFLFHLSVYVAFFSLIKG